MLLASVDAQGEAFPDAGRPSVDGSGDRDRFVAIPDDGARVAFVTGANGDPSPMPTSGAWRTYVRNLAAFPAPTTGVAPLPRSPATVADWPVGSA